MWPKPGRFFTTRHGFLVRFFSALLLISCVGLCLLGGQVWIRSLLVVFVTATWIEWCVLMVRNSMPTAVHWAMLLLVFFAGAFVLIRAFLFFWSITAYSAEVWFYLLGLTWATDTGAYFCGKVCGGPRLVPRLSPQKTWSGAAGGLVCGMLTGTGIFVLYLPQGPLWGRGLFLTFILTIAAQAGDLLESAAKRFCKVKDSGSLIPGHGGFCDRLDSLLGVGFACDLIFYFSPVIKTLLLKESVPV